MQGYILAYLNSVWLGAIYVAKQSQSYKDIDYMNSDSNRILCFWLYSL